MISGYAERSSGLHHPHHKPQNFHNFRERYLNRILFMPSRGLNLEG
jgi:hypothetical protein